jgi:hypothetical protein
MPAGDEANRRRETKYSTSAEYLGNLSGIAFGLPAALLAVSTSSSMPTGKWNREDMMPSCAQSMVVTCMEVHAGQAVV